MESWKRKTVGRASCLAVATVNLTLETLIYVREQSEDMPFSERVLEAVVPTLDIGVDESLRAGHSSQAHHVDEKHFHSASPHVHAVSCNFLFEGRGTLLMLRYIS